MMLVQTHVAPSLIHGMGLFASQLIPQGTAIWKFEAGFDRKFPPAQLRSLPASAQEHIRWFAFVGKEDGNAVLSGDHACFMNHSAAPNTGTVAAQQKSVTTVALRDIAAGEEITCNYFDFDADAPRKLGGNI
ncbi:MAG: SET domain-containing protein-lysine N-methyltransferase [Pedosphaera sp.]|nr:SET domain-containing protein-lysine N-methyltransferase [Pedosphaera sp.]